jgi:hypothetical protein
MTLVDLSLAGVALPFAFLLRLMTDDRAFFIGLAAIGAALTIFLFPVFERHIQAFLARDKALSSKGGVNTSEARGTLTTMSTGVQGVRIQTGVAVADWIDLDTILDLATHGTACCASLLLALPVGWLLREAGASPQALEAGKWIIGAYVLLVFVIFAAKTIQTYWNRASEVAHYAGGR